MHSPAIHSMVMLLVRPLGCASNTSSTRAAVIGFSAMIGFSLAFTIAPSPVLALGGPSPTLLHQLKQDSPTIEVRARAGGAVVRPGYRGGVRWARPGRYRWPVGGAIAAGAALGVVTAASAAAWAGDPPEPGTCWYYTDPSRRQGFWDYCQ